MAICSLLCLAGFYGMPTTDHANIIVGMASSNGCFFLLDIFFKEKQASRNQLVIIQQYQKDVTIKRKGEGNNWQESSSCPGIVRERTKAYWGSPGPCTMNSIWIHSSTKPTLTALTCGFLLGRSERNLFTQSALLMDKDPILTQLISLMGARMRESHLGLHRGLQPTPAQMTDH